MSDKKSFVLLYLKSFSVNLSDDVNEAKLLDYMNRDLRRKSIVDRMGQVTLTLTDDAIVLSKPLWWSTKSGQRLPYTQLREAYVFGKDNKRIAIDILSLETKQRRVLLFKTRNLDERETLIELLTQRKMAREMYEKDNIHQVEYANWTSTYADDASYHPSGNQSPVSVSSEQSAVSESPLFTKPRAQSLPRQSIDQPMKTTYPEEAPAEAMRIFPPNRTPIVSQTAHDNSYQSERANMDPGRWTVEPWRGADDWRQQRILPCCPAYCNHNGQPSQQHTNINIVFHGQPGPGTMSTEPGGNPSQMNAYTFQSPADPATIVPSEIQIQPAVDPRLNPLSQKAPSQWDYTENISGNNVRLMQSQTSSVSPSPRSIDYNYGVKQYPAAKNRIPCSSGSIYRAVSQPDLTIKLNGKEVDPSVRWDASSRVNHGTYTNAYNLISVPQGSKNKENAYHTTLITKAGGSNPEIKDWRCNSSMSTEHHTRDEFIRERIIRSTSSAKPQYSHEVKIVRPPSMRNLTEAHHGWVTHTKYFEVRSNSLAKLTENGSRYVTISTPKVTGDS